MLKFLNENIKLIILFSHRIPKSSKFSDSSLQMMNSGYSMYKIAII